MPGTADIVIVKRIEHAFACRSDIKQRVYRRTRTVGILDDHGPSRIHRRIMLAVRQRTHLTDIRYLAVFPVCDIFQFYRITPVLCPASGHISRKQQSKSNLFHFYNLFFYSFFRKNAARHDASGL